MFAENDSLGRNRHSPQDSDSRQKKDPPVASHAVRKHTSSGTPSKSSRTDGVARQECIHHRYQFAWRIVDGKATSLRYDIRDLPGSTTLPLPTGLRSSRSEFGIEVILILAFLHYWVGVSQDNAIQIMNFFTGLNLSKSQADSLLSQLADDWEQQRDTIAELIALQKVLYIDETGWKVGAKSC